MARKNHPYTAKAKGWLRIKKKKSLEENVLKNSGVYVSGKIVKLFY